MTDAPHAARTPDTALHRRPMRTDTVLAFTLAALIFYIAALVLPLATAAKFGEKHSGYLLSGVANLWQQGDWLLALVVFGCGILAPLLLVGSLGRLLLAARTARPRPELRPWLHLGARLHQWSMPEVQLLGVIVAFIKLSSLVATRPAPGLWCYGLAAACTLFAWKNFDAPAVSTVLFPALRRTSP